MIDTDRERHDALREDPPPIDPRYYGQYSDVIGRSGRGVEWFERQVEDWEADHPVRVKRKRQ